MDLERDLRLLEVDWPATPAFRLVPAPPPRGRRRLLLALAAALVAAIVAAFAVPQSRGAILRFFHLGGVSVHVVGTLPRAEERPLGADLGPVVSRAEAEQVVPRLRLPALAETPPLHRAAQVVSLVFRSRGHDVLLSELPGDAGIVKKLALDETNVEFLDVDGGFGAWISGRRHVVDYP